jgi:hypothetical protein
MYATRETGSGLVVAEEAMDEARVGRALKDDRPTGSCCRSIAARCRAAGSYKVILRRLRRARRRSSSRGQTVRQPAPTVVGNARQGAAAPPRRGRVDADADEQNAHRLAGIGRDRVNTDEAIATTTVPYVDRGRVSVGLSTKAAKPYWQRNGQNAVLADAFDESNRAPTRRTGSGPATRGCGGSRSGRSGRAARRRHVHRELADGRRAVRLPHRVALLDSNGNPVRPIKDPREFFDVYNANLALGNSHAGGVHRLGRLDPCRPERRRQSPACSCTRSRSRRCRTTATRPGCRTATTSRSCMARRRRGSS